MKKVIVPFACLLIAFNGITQKTLTAKERETDSIISVEIVHPFVDNAEDTPDWDVLNTNVTKKYDSKYAQRAVIRGKIFYNAGKDWNEFNANLVEYTDKYEDPANAKLMNMNAAMILRYSNDKTQLKQALAWSKKALDKEPANEKYKKTYKDLQEKIGQN